ncbi:MAG TPA: S41 family peptidase [Bryobacteraceae bacterium]|nr:S41 family peptidase [Bryobacteraceae bacterium]
MNSRTKWFVVSGSTCLTVMLLVGSLLGKSADQQSDVYKHLTVFSDVVAHIKSEYVEEPDMKAVTLGALNGMLEAIDPFASYLNADQYRDYQRNKDLKRAGVGLILSKKFGYLGVVDAIPESPAAKAGLVTGDMLEGINGITTRDMALASAEMLLQGESGTPVELSVVRVRRPEPTKVSLIRANIVLPAVESKIIDDGVGYVNIDALSPALVKDVATAVQRLQKEGAKKLVVDVRSCATGTPDDGIALANLFLNKGRITYVKGQRYPQKNFDADPAKAITALPMAVLTNSGTADAAEIMAAAVQDNKRGKVVGERTHGDAAVRQPITMDDGGVIILSVAKYYSPDGKAIQDTGVVPGTPIREAEVQMEFDDNGLPIVSTKDLEEKKKTENDPVVKKALEALANG